MPTINGDGVNVVRESVRVEPRVDGDVDDALNFAGWGHTHVIPVLRVRDDLLVAGETAVDAVRRATQEEREGGKPKAPHTRLDQFRATSIAGNDLLSSCLYTAGICAQYAGKMAPIALSLVSFMLYFFRYVYSEVVTAMPVNGGSYNALLNTTSKPLAAMAACLSLISYVATAVVSGYDAVIYAQSAYTSTGTAHSPFVEVGTIVVLAFFAGLTLLGVGESAAVATGMFFFHVATLTALLLCALVYAFKDGWHLFVDNWHTGYPDIVSASGVTIAHGTAGTAIFFGYAAALLGITGFETAANYVEEMKDSRTYVATLRNMWVAALFNPVISFFAMAVMPMGDVNDCNTAASQNSIMCRPNDMLAAMAQVVGGNELKVLVCVDGALVLAGSVLTAYVGVMGLVRRMALDRCLPDFLLATNKLRGTPHWIIFVFLGLTSSLFLLLTLPNMHSDGNAGIDNLSGVYDIAFLSVMSAFAISCMVLKWKRPDLPRLIIASWGTVFAALGFVLAGLIGNIMKGPQVLQYFVLYFAIALALVFSMFYRSKLLQFILHVVRNVLSTRDMRRKQGSKKRQLLLAHMRAEAEAVRRDGRPEPAVGIDALPSLSRAASPAGSEDNSNDTLLVVEDNARGICSCWKKRPEAEMPEDADLQLPLVADGSEPAAPRGVRAWILDRLQRAILDTNSRPIIYFAKEGDLATLNKAVLYVKDNEQTHRLTVVHVVDDRQAVRRLGEELARRRAAREAAAAPGSSAPEVDPIADAQEAVAMLDSLREVPESTRLLMDNVSLLDAVYPKLRIDCLVLRGTYFSPAAVKFVSSYLNVPTNMMFMAMPDARFPHQFAALGGVRVITRSGNVNTRTRDARRVRSVLHNIADDMGKATPVSCPSPR